MKGNNEVYCLLLHIWAYEFTWNDCQDILANKATF